MAPCCQEYSRSTWACIDSWYQAASNEAPPSIAMPKDVPVPATPALPTIEGPRTEDRPGRLGARWRTPEAPAQRGPRGFGPNDAQGVRVVASENWGGAYALSHPIT